jgi:Asp/Glu/hydantoin racemase
MKTILAIYTGRGLDETIRQLFDDILPGNRLVNLIDDSLIADVVSAGRVTPAVTRRLIHYFLRAEDIGAEIILNTCSSVGEIVDLGRKICGVPIVRIDEPMANAAIERFDRIGVIATLPSTLEPTMRLIETTAQAAGKPVSVVDGLAAGAYDQLVSGNPEEHDRRILKTAIDISPSVDGIVLAQGSMMRIAELLAERLGKPVLSSPRLGLEAVRQILEESKSSG